MLRSSLSAIGVIALGATTLAQQDASSRLHSTTQKPRQITYEMASGTLRPQKGPSAFFGPEIVYNNNCIQGTLFFAGMSAGDAFLDNGEVPSSSNGELAGCDDMLVMNGFTFGYCADQPTVDAMICFYELHDNCSAITGATGSTCWYTLTGLPGSNTGIPLCWALTVDLMGTTIEWPFLADGDGVWNGSAAQDTFGYTYEILNVTGTATGIILAGEPIHLGQGCDFAVGSVYEPADPTGTSPQGTGYGSTDSFGLNVLGTYAGCFFFGGWPANPWSSYYMVVFEEDAGCGGGLETVVCDSTNYGTGGIPACPCGNAAGPGEGCFHTGGVGAMLTVEDNTVGNFGCTASQCAVGNGGQFVAGTAMGGAAPPIYEGVTCVGGSTNRLLPGFESSPGVRQTTGGALITAGTIFSPGNTYWLVYWYRDVAGGPTPCGSSGMANFSATVTFVLAP